MSIEITTHINFDGQAREALDFWASAFGGTVTAATYGQMGASQDPAWADRTIPAPSSARPPAQYRIAMSRTAGPPAPPISACVALPDALADNVAAPVASDTA